VVKALASGRIERDGAGLIDPEVAEAQWALNTGARIVTPLLRVAASPAELAVDRTWSPAAQRERLIARLAPGLVGADAETIAEALREAFTAGDDAQMIHLRHMLDEMCDELLPRP
jgi:hypothetical protein